MISDLDNLDSLSRQQLIELLWQACEAYDKQALEIRAYRKQSRKE